MIRCKVINKTEFQQFVDKVGLGNKEDIVVVPPKGVIVLGIFTNKQFVRLNKQFANKLIFKKL